MAAEGYLTRNDEEFRLYRKYQVESELKFDDVTPPPAARRREERAAGGAAREEEVAARGKRRFPICGFAKFANIMKPGAQNESRPVPGGRWIMPIPGLVRRIAPESAGQVYLRLERLREMGRELRRPEADFLRDGIYELRVSLQGVHHRILYFFHGAVAAVVSHGLIKEAGPSPQGRLSALWNARSGSSQPAETHLRGGLTWPRRSKPASDAVDILHRRFYEGQPGRLKNLEEARANEEIARKIHESEDGGGPYPNSTWQTRRTPRRRSFCRLEDAEYEGHSLAMLRRIGAALNQRVEIRFVPIRRSA